MKLDRRMLLANTICGVLFWLSSLFGFMSVKYVSFPVKIVISAAKLLIAMPTSVVLRGFKSPKGTIFGYTRSEIAVSVALFIGLVIMFLPSSSGKGLLANFSFIGVVLMILSINLTCIFDEVQSGMIRKGLSMQVVLMWNMLFTSIITAISLLVQGNLIPTFQLIAHNPVLLRNLLLLAVSHLATQISIVSLKSHHGIWWKNIVASIRKCISFIISVIVFGHSITTQQIVGIVIVFACLFWAGSIEMKRSEAEQKEQKSRAPRVLLRMRQKQQRRNIHMKKVVDSAKAKAAKAQRSRIQKKMQKQANKATMMASFNRPQPKKAAAAQGSQEKVEKKKTVKKSPKAPAQPVQLTKRQLARQKALNKAQAKADKVAAKKAQAKAAKIERKKAEKKAQKLAQKISQKKQQAAEKN